MLVIQCTSSNKAEKINAKVNSTDTTSTAIDEEVTPKPITYSWKTKKQKKEACFDPDKEDDDYTDFCSSREIEIGQISLEDKTIEKRINDAIIRTAIGNDKKTVKISDWLKEVESLEENGEAYTESITCQLLERGPKHIVVSISTDSYFYGAAHPSMVLDILNFNLETGNIIGLSDVFKPGYGKALKQLVEKQFIKQNGFADWNFTPRNGDFELANEFSISSKGIVFSYNQYEIGPYAAGMPEVIVPYSLIIELFAKDSYLFELVEKTSK
jgi:hypothetical protein